MSVSSDRIRHKFLHGDIVVFGDIAIIANFASTFFLQFLGNF
jgi:hypothetical protein